MGCNNFLIACVGLGLFVISLLFAKFFSTHIMQDNYFLAILVFLMFISVGTIALYELTAKGLVSGYK